MIRNEEAKAVFFENMVLNQREEVLSWLRFKYNDLLYADAEDIFQDASWELWQDFCKRADWHGESLVGRMKVFCRNIHGHWLRHHSHTVEWDDSYYPQDVSVESDYGYISGGTARMMLKERMYAMIDRLAPKDRSLIEMYLQDMRMDEIAHKLGYKNQQVAKNRKSKIVVKLSKEINAQAEHACAYFFRDVLSFTYVFMREITFWSIMVYIIVKPIKVHVYENRIIYRRCYDL